MGRIRTIKPEFPQSESMGSISRDARLCFILLWTLADDSGRLRGNSRMLASLLYPYDNDVPKLIESWLSELERQKCIVRYQVDGGSYVEICNWLIHQKIDKPTKSKIPPFDESSRILANPRECSSEDQGSRTKDQGSKEGIKGSAPRKARAGADAPLCPVSVPDEIWRDFVAHRKSINAPLTQTAMDGIQREADKAGMSLADVLREICARGWRGFKAEWIKKAASITNDDDDPDAWVHKSLRKNQPKDVEGEAWTRTITPLFGKS